LRRRGRYGLVFIDGLRPYFRDHDVIALGEREHDPDVGDIVSTEVYDPELDPDRSRAELLVTMLQDALTSQW
jgi:hypothetical protein